MPVQKLKELLDEHHVKYVVMTHSQAYTAQEVAASAHIPGREVAKTVMVKLDGRMIMVVVPASHRVNLEKLMEATGASKAELASEEEFSKLFPDCSPGAMPPFGNLYGLDVVVAKRLTQDVEIAFNAGSHTELMRLPYKDFEDLVHPKVLSLT